jgi:L-aspartate oxidase
MVQASFAAAPERYCQDAAQGSAPSASDVRDIMWRQAGLMRSEASLRPAAAQLSAWRSAIVRARDRAPGDRELRRVASLATVGLLIARAALRREESRGGHFREDFPQRDDIHWLRHVADVLQR